MRSRLLLLMMCCAISAQAGDLFTSHSAFYGSVARTEHLPQAFAARPQNTPSAGDLGLKLAGLAPAWGQVELRPDNIVVNRHPWPWAQARRAFGRDSKPLIDIELVRVAEGPSVAGQPARLCVQSPAGSSGSAARWQHVIVIERWDHVAKPRMITWFAPYASCEAVFTGPGGELVAGTFDMQFESEQSITSALFNLHALTEPPEQPWPRYVLQLQDPANAFQFTATRAPVPPALR